MKRPSSGYGSIIATGNELSRDSRLSICHHGGIFLIDRCLLEDSVPVALVNKEAKKEKKAVSPHVLLHYYPTRKPLITARLAIAGSVLPSSILSAKQEFHQLMNLDATLKNRAYISVPDRLKTILSKYASEDITILDPFAGTGTIPFEAVRMGFDVVALDYNPVAYLTMKGTIEYPIKYGDILESGKSKLFVDVERYASKIFLSLKKELDIFYPVYEGQRVKCYIHAWAVKCPFCERITPLVTNWDLDKEKSIRLVPHTEEGNLHFEIVEGKDGSSGTVYYGKGTCVYSDCTHPIPNDYIVEDIAKNQREMLLAMYLGSHKFVLPRKEDLDALEKAKEYFDTNLTALSKYIPTEKMTPESNCLKYLTYWYRLHSPRQLLLLASFVREIRTIVEEIKKTDADYAAVIGTYLSMIFSKHLMRNSRSSAWNVYGVKTEHVLSNKRPSIMWCHSEINPFEKTAGSIQNAMENILSGLEFIIEQISNNSSKMIDERIPNVELLNQSILSWQREERFKVIITDPPYYNDVQYPDLMQFYQVWHNKTVGDLIDIPSTPSTTEELSVTLNSDERDEHMFESRMRIALSRIHRLLEDDGILVMFYAHKSIDGWKYVLDALRKARFIVTSTHTLRTEGTGVLAQTRSSVFHSLLLTARKRLDDKTIRLADLDKEVREKMESRYSHLVEIYGEDRLNLMVAASGIVIETITSYAEIESFTRNTAEYALETGQKYLIELFAKRSLGIDYVDPKTMLYVWLRYSPSENIPFSEFNQTLKALGIDESLSADFIHKEGNKVRLLDYTERGPLEVSGTDHLVDTSVIDSVHRILRAYIRGGLTEASAIIRNSTYGETMLLHTLEGLAKIASLRPGYKEGETSREFLVDWGILHDRGKSYQDEKLDKYLTEDDEA